MAVNSVGEHCSVSMKNEEQKNNTRVYRCPFTCFGSVDILWKKFYNQMIFTNRDKGRDLELYSWFCYVFNTSTIHDCYYPLSMTVNNDCCVFCGQRFKLIYKMYIIYSCLWTQIPHFSCHHEIQYNSKYNSKLFLFPFLMLLV